MTVESVVLLDAEGRAVGTAPKSQVHHANTPLHLAFSLYLFTPAGELLLTRRAAAKRTFPRLWTNSVCGHPGPGESLPCAIGRRARAELGLSIEGLRLVLPDFAYRAEMDGVVENEMCPVYVGWLAHDAELAPDPAEVSETAWVQWRGLTQAVQSGKRALSPWSAQQIERLDELGPHPADWPTGDSRLLPAAVR